jgi:hypothetical protein
MVIGRIQGSRGLLREQLAPGPVTDPSTVERYEALIRIANSIRARKEP